MRPVRGCWEASFSFRETGGRGPNSSSLSVTCLMTWPARGPACVPQLPSLGNVGDIRLVLECEQMFPQRVFARVVLDERRHCCRSLCCVAIL
jgi:hypothetical protein